MDDQDKTSIKNLNLKISNRKYQELRGFAGYLDVCP